MFLSVEAAKKLSECTRLRERSTGTLNKGESLAAQREPCNNGISPGKLDNEIIHLIFPPVYELRLAADHSHNRIDCAVDLLNPALGTEPVDIPFDAYVGQ